MNYIKTATLFISLFIITVSCSSTEKTTGSTEKTSSVYPAWFNSSGFEADSVTYSGFATGLASDSVEALENSEKYARISLESELASRLESVRVKMEANGSTLVQQRDFIIMLRNAHNEVQDAAERVNSSSRKDKNAYRGFAEVQITRNRLMDLLKKGFSNNPEYWNTFSSSDAFASGLE